MNIVLINELKTEVERTSSEDMCEQLIGLFTMLVLSFTLETVRTVHFPGFMVPAIDEHTVRIQPLDKEIDVSVSEKTRPRKGKTDISTRVLLK